MNAYTGAESEVHEVDPYIEMAMDDVGAYAQAPGAPAGEVEGELAATPAPLAAAPVVVPTPLQAALACVLPVNGLRRQS